MKWLGWVVAAIAIATFLVNHRAHERIENILWGQVYRYEQALHPGEPFAVDREGVVISHG